MAKADRVHSTPPTNTPVDLTRRCFITIAAGASIVSVGSLVAAAAPNAAPEVSSAPVDPIYAAIEAHRTAYATMQAVFAEQQRAHDLADARVGPEHLDIPSMVEPGETVEACCWSDIERAVPREQFPDLNAHHNRLLDERKTAHAAIVESLIGDEDEATEEVARPEFEALQEFAETTPTTLKGLLAMVAYAGEINAEQPDAFADRDTSIFEIMATAARAIVGRQS
jgi:hypothetical protein